MKAIYYNFRFQIFLILLFLLSLQSAFSIQQTVSEDTGGFAFPGRDQRYPLYIQHADYGIQFDIDSAVMVYGKGNVVMTYGDATLYSDEVWYTASDSTFHAKGHVVYYYRPSLKEPYRVMKCEEMIYNRGNDRGAVYQSRTFVPPLFIRAPTVQQVNPKKQIIFDGSFTTCNLEHPHYHFTAQKIAIYPHDILIAYNIVMYIGNVPVMYFPYLRRSLKNNDAFFDIEGGKSSRVGSFVKSSYQFPITKDIVARLRLDYFSKEGTGEGLDLKYDYGKEAQGVLQTYYIHENDTGEDRYRIFLKHRTYLTDDISVSLYANYASDNAVDEDYLHTHIMGKMDTREEYVSVDKWDSNYQIRLMARQIQEWIDDTSKIRSNSFSDVTGSYQLQQGSSPQLEGTLKYQKISSTPFYYTASGSVGEMEHYTGYTTSTNESTYRSLDVNVEQDVSYAKPLTKQITFFSSVGVINDYAQKTSEFNDVNDFDTFLQERLRLEDRITRNLKADLIYTAEEQTENNSEYAPATLALNDLGGRLSYRVPNSSMRIRWQGDYNILPEDELNVGQRQYYTRLDVTWNPTKIISYNIAGVAARALENDTTYGLYFSQEQSLWASAKVQPKDWWWVSLSGYFQASQTPANISGNTNTVALYPSFSTFIGKKWRLDGSTSISLNTGTLDEQDLTLYRDLHCWEAYIRYSHTPTDNAIHFVIRIKAFSHPAFAPDPKTSFE